MPGTGPTRARLAGSGADWLATIASLCVGAAFLALWFWLFPPWLGIHFQRSGIAWWRWLAMIPAAFGFGVAIRCIWNFGSAGHGTPAPMAPPARLVAVGFYRYVRNPMYLGFFLGWASLWAIFGRVTAARIEISLAVIAGVALFVYYYEEPALRRKFGADYDEYCRQVRRWLPRLHPWNPA